MIFRKKKPAADSRAGPAVLRGRDSLEEGGTPSSAGKDNPLARRFHPQDEPDTIDLDQPPRFHADDAGSATETATRDLGPEPDTEDGRTSVPTPGGAGLITFVAETGKFYLQPGSGGLLNGEAVTAPTELRHGDRIRIGASELLFRPADS